MRTILGISNKRQWEQRHTKSGEGGVTQKQEKKEIEYVCEFPCLGSLIASNGQMDLDVSRRIALKVFGSQYLLIKICKRKVYQACSAVWI